MVKKHRIHFEKNPEDDYEVHVGSGILDTILPHIRDNISKKREVILTDKNVVDAGHLANLNPLGYIPTFVVDCDDNGSVESRKNVKTYGDIID